MVEHWGRVLWKKTEQGRRTVTAGIRVSILTGWSVVRRRH